MPDYTPVFAPGRSVTLTASAAVTGGQPLEVSGSGTVAPVTLGATPSMKIIGVAEDDTPANGRVTVWCRGFVHESVPVGTVTAGDQLTSPVTGDTGQVKTLPAVSGAPGLADVNAARAIFGIALTTATNPTKVRWVEI